MWQPTQYPSMLWSSVMRSDRTVRGALLRTRGRVSRCQWGWGQGASEWQRRGLKIELFLFAYYRAVFPLVMYGCDSWTTKKAEELMNCGVEDS